MQEKITKDLMLEIMKRAGYCHGTDITRPGINGISLTFGPDRIRAVATDGHRLAVWNEITAPGYFESVTIPTAALDYIWKHQEYVDYIIVGEAKGDTRPIQINMKNEEGGVIFKLKQHDFPNHKLVTPNQCWAQVSALTVKLKRAVLGIKKEKHKIVGLLVDQNSLYIYGELEGERKTTQREKVGDLVVVGSTYDDYFKTGYDLTYFYECLKSIPHVSVNIKLLGVYDPLIITSTDSTHVLMPMRI